MMSLVSLLEGGEDSPAQQSNSCRVRVTLVQTRREVFFELPRDRWYSLTVKEFLEVVSAQAPPSHPPGALFLSSHGREQILDEALLLTEYDVTNKECVLLFKPRPRLVHMIFHKQFYVDPSVTVEDAVPLMHYALARHEWFGEDEEIFAAVPAVDHLPIPRDATGGAYFEGDVLSAHQFERKSSSDRLLESVGEGLVPTFVLSGESTPLLACVPTPIAEFTMKAPKQKSLSYTRRNDSDEPSGKEENPSNTTGAHSSPTLSAIHKRRSTDPVDRGSSSKDDDEVETSERSLYPHQRVLKEQGVDLPQPLHSTGSTSSEAILPPSPADGLRVEPIEDPKAPSAKSRSRSFLSLRSDSILRLPFMGGPKSDILPASSRHENVPIHLQGLIAVDNGKRVFGLPFETVMEREEETEDVPRFLRQMTDYLIQTNALQSEGIFRLCGAQDNIVALINEIDSGLPLELAKYNIHEIANVFKLYFQLLPQPIFTYKLYPRFMAAVCLEDEELRNTYYNALLATLSDQRRNLSRFLLNFLVKVAEARDSNKMGARNLGIVFGPLLLENEKRENDVYKSYMHYSKYIINCTKHMVASMDKLYVPSTPVLTVRALCSYSAKKPGELDVQEGSILAIITQTDDECFTETNGRFGTLPAHYLFDSNGQIKSERQSLSSPLASPKGMRRKKKKGGSGIEGQSPPTVSRSPSMAKLTGRRGSKTPHPKKKKCATLSDKDLESAFTVPPDIFALLPRWKQDEILRENGLLDPIPDAPVESGSGRSLVHRDTKTIPAGPKSPANSKTL